jgi:AraC family transcriptional regulator
MTETSQPEGRDRLRELLDAVLDEENTTLAEMAGGAFSSQYHFSRQLSRGAGEPPVAMRRRVMLERAAWRLRGGASVTDVAFQAGYESVEGFGRAFARAYGHAPSETQAQPGKHWLPAPNGIHFHPPFSLWIDSTEASEPAGSEVTALMVRHDLDDVADLLDAVKGLSEEEYRRVHLPGHSPLVWDGEDSSLADVMRHLVLSREIWLAAIEGEEFPDMEVDDRVELARRYEEAAPRWLAMVRDVERRGAWGDRIVDALCDPPESFVLGSVLAHVLTFSAHRRQLARLMLRAAGQDPGEGDPITWLRRRTGGWK